MPGMSGWESADKITGLKPGIRILYMPAGISMQEWNDRRDKPVGTYFIQKPFRLDELKALLMAIFWNEEPSVRLEPTARRIWRS